MIKARLKQFLGHPITSLVFAGILIYSGLSEIWSTFWEDIRSHHFVSLCGLLNLVKAGLDLYDGKEQFGKFFHRLFDRKNMRNKSIEYVVIYEKGDSSYGAYVPDLPGCITVGETLEETQTLIQEAIEFHIEGLQEDGEDVPQPSLNLPIECDIPFFGKHKVIENYVYYDYPMLFSCRDSAGHLYLIIVGEDDQHKTWLRVGISNERFNLIRSGGIDLRNAFTDSENGYLFRIRVPDDDPTQSSPEVIHPDEIPEDLLPFPGERLGLKTDAPPALSNQEEMVKVID